MEYCTDFKKKLEYIHNVNVEHFPLDLSIVSFYKILGIDYDYSHRVKDVLVPYNCPITIDEEVLDCLNIKGETLLQKKSIFLNSISHLHGCRVSSVLNMNYKVIIADKTLVCQIVYACRNNLHRKLIELVSWKYAEYLKTKKKYGEVSSSSTMIID